jgi:hypothetical protein
VQNIFLDSYVAKSTLSKYKNRCLYCFCNDKSFSQHIYAGGVFLYCLFFTLLALKTGMFWYNIIMAGGVRMNDDELLIVIKDMFEKKTDEIKGMFNNKTDEIKQYVDDKIKGQSILIENLQKTIKTVAEGHSGLDRKIDNLHGELVETKQELKGEINGLKVEVNGLKKEMTVVKEYMIGVDAKLNEHEVILRKVK